jgi:GNAT superfamily N-acetyltransferase
MPILSESRVLYSICSVSALDVAPLRGKILLAGEIDSARFRGDDDPSTLHLAVRRGDLIVAVATICREPLPGSSDNAAWRLRGVAVEPELQRHGFGKVLMKLCLEHAERHAGRLAWCTARESARGFYESLGFASAREPFTLPSRGDALFYEMHYVLPGAPVIDAE